MEYLMPTSCVYFVLKIGKKIQLQLTGFNTIEYDDLA